MTLNLEKINSKDPKIKYAFARELLQYGKETPELLYNHLTYWTKMIDNDNNILKWTAIDIIGYLSQVDRDNKIERSISHLIDLLHGGHLITSNHCIQALGLIAINKPAHRIKIIKDLIAISKDQFDTEECKNIAIGKVIETLGNFLKEIQNDKIVLNFIEQALNSTRNATRRKAEMLKKKISKFKSPTQ